jgi:hypothetical protein
MISVSLATNQFVDAGDREESGTNRKEVVFSDSNPEDLSLEGLDGPFCQCLGEGAFHELKMTSVDLVEASR